MVFLTDEAIADQQEINASEGDPRLTKRRWYAEARVANDWMLDAMQKSLECLILRDGDCRLDQRGQGEDEIRPSAFADLVIPLGRVWKVIGSAPRTPHTLRTA